MTKPWWRAALLSGCAYATTSSASLSLRTEGADFALLTPRLEASWAAWERRAATEVPATLTLARVEGALEGGLGGRSRGTRLELSARVPATELESLARHELAHAFWARRCPSPRSTLVDEALALALSGDTERLASASPFLADSLALLQRSPLWSVTARVPAPAAVQRALARLLLDPARAQAQRAWLQMALRDCAGGKARLESDLRNWLARGEGADARRLQWAVWNAHSRRIEASLGSLTQPFAVGSLLKPLWLHLNGELSDARVSTGGRAWNCPRAGVPRGWTWEEALAKSCNGFFLDGAAALERTRPGSFTSRLSTFKAITGAPLPVALSPAQAVGLVPGLRLSLRDLTSLYGDLSERASTLLLAALARTFVDGTLAENPHATWFRERGYLAKSGTVRDERGSPREAWLALGGHPDAATGRPGYWLLLHGTAVTPGELLGPARALLENSPWTSDRPARVQVLALYRPERVRWRCGAGQLRRTRGEIARRFADGLTAAELRAGDRLSCGGSALVAEVTAERAGFRRHEFSGTIEVRAPGVAAAPAALRPRQRQARDGSEFWLETSERAYVVGVLAAEFPRARSATLAALGYAVRRNVRAGGRHGAGAPLCDTTHCQVFRTPERFPAALLAKLGRAADAFPRLERALAEKTPTRSWFEFSLGGTAPWGREISLGELHLKLGRAFAGKIPRAGSRECEQLREHLQLPSCPQSARRTAGGWTFRGAGEGHGWGLDLTRAERLAVQGEAAEKILRGAYAPGRPAPAAEPAPALAR